MCELFAESLSDSDEATSHLNLSNVLLLIITSYHIGNTLEACLTEEELGRLSLSCHFSVHISVRKLVHALFELTDLSYQ